MIEAAGGDDWVKANYLPMTLSGATWSWLINLSENTIKTWDQLCTTFIGNFQEMYKRLSTTEALKTVKQKHDESLHDYVKCFCNTRNAIPHIQGIEVINTFRDGVYDFKAVMEIAMKPKPVAELLAVTDECINMFKALTRLLDNRGKGLKKKQDNQEVNTASYGDRDRSDRKFKRPFRWHEGVKKWCDMLQ
jgi:hypothetical protein